MQSDAWLILGVTPEGRTFRPSDWTERLCGILACHDCQKRWVYSEYAQPVMHSGQVGVRVISALEHINPDAYQFIMNFARTNRLKLIPLGKVIHLSGFAPPEEISPPAHESTAA